jgi:hypothetical protein
MQCDVSQVGKWVAQEEEIRARPKKKSVHRGKKPQFQEKEKELSTWIRHRRDVGAVVTRLMVIARMSKTCPQFFLKPQHEQDEWWLRFKQREKWTTRRLASIRRQMLQDCPIIKTYRAIISEMVTKHKIVWFVNGDETFIPEDNTGKLTIDEIGKARPAAKTSGADKKNVTVWF